MFISLRCGSSGFRVPVHPGKLDWGSWFFSTFSSFGREVEVDVSCQKLISTQDRCCTFFLLTDWGQPGFSAEAASLASPSMTVLHGSHALSPTLVWYVLDP